MVAGVLIRVGFSNLKNFESKFQTFGTGADSKYENVTPTIVGVKPVLVWSQQNYYTGIGLQDFWAVEVCNGFVFFGGR